MILQIYKYRHHKGNTIQHILAECTESRTQTICSGFLCSFIFSKPRHYKKMYLCISINLWMLLMNLKRLNCSNMQLLDILLCVILYYVFWAGGLYVQINNLSWVVYYILLRLYNLRNSYYLCVPFYFIATDNFHNWK